MPSKDYGAIHPPPQGPEWRVTRCGWAHFHRPVMGRICCPAMPATRLPGASCVGRRRTAGHDQADPRTSPPLPRLRRVVRCQRMRPCRRVAVSRAASSCPVGAFRPSGSHIGPRKAAHGGGKVCGPACERPSRPATPWRQGSGCLRRRWRSSRRVWRCRSRSPLPHWRRSSPQPPRS